VLTANAGLQCHTARHCWKIVFLSDSQLYELVLTACSPKEELEWRARLGDSQQAANPDSDQLPPDMFSFLALNIKSLGTVFRKPGAFCFHTGSRLGLLTMHRNHCQENIDTPSNHYWTKIPSLPSHLEEHQRRKGGANLEPCLDQQVTIPAHYQ
jgi:hypothetical protein